MSLRTLSDQQILARIQELTRRERSLTLAVLVHLYEIERRRLHLKLGYSSMFDYCTSGLGYSASAASRRIRSARCVARFPEVYDLLKSNEVNVSTVAQVSRVISAANKEQILARIRGKSQREVEAIVAEFEPLEAMPKDRVRTVVVRVPAAMLAKGEASLISTTISVRAKDFAAPKESDLETLDTENHDRNGRAPDTPAAETACPVLVGGGAPSNLQRRALLQFSASETFMVKLELARSLVWHRLPANASLESIFELALDLLLEREDPRERKQRRERKAMSRQPANNSAAPAPARAATTVTVARRISAAVRDNVYARDGGECSFTGPMESDVHPRQDYKSTTSSPWSWAEQQQQRISASCAPITIVSKPNACLARWDNLNDLGLGRRSRRAGYGGTNPGRATWYLGSLRG